jgi:CheY-like chemotaxis protein
MTPPPVLYAEDEDNDVFIMKRAFRDAAVPNPLIIATNGQEAIDYLSGAGQYADRAKSPLPRLLLLDLKMPRVSGFEVLQWIRGQRNFDALPVVILTSSTHHEDMLKAYGLRANAYLIKPTHPAKLLEMTKSIKDFWLTQNEPPPTEP